MTRSQTHPEAVALYRAILAHPDEDTPRLVYADWLDENGDAADRTFAEFIRVQGRLAHMNTWDDGYTAERVREWLLAREVGTSWCQPPGAPADTTKPPDDLFAPSRGFADTVKVSGEDISRKQARDWFRCRPIQRAEYCFSDEMTDPPWLLTTDTLPGLRSLRLNFYLCTFENRSVVYRALVAAENLSGLTRLEIDDSVSLADLKAIVTSRHLKRLEALSLSGQAAHAALLAEKAKLPALRELTLTIRRPDEEEGHRGARRPAPRWAQALGRAEWFARLHTLRFPQSVGLDDELGDAGLEALLGSQPLPELRTFEIRANYGLSRAVGRLLGGPGLPGLRDLTLDYFPSLPDWRKAAAGPQELLSFTTCMYTDKDTKRVFDGPALRNLRRLVARGSWKRAVVAELARSPLTQSLRWLSFSASEADSAAPLLTGRDWPHLEYLSIKYPIPWKTLLALIESDKFPRLVGLSVQCREGSVLLKRLAKCPAAAKFRELNLGAQPSAATAGALADSPHLDNLDRLILNLDYTKGDVRGPLVKRFGKRFASTRDEDPLSVGAGWL
jgi:uncharacterized protein (TIGR02996 family)